MRTNDILVVIDVQKEYQAEGRPFRLEGIEPSLRAIARALAAARQGGLPVCHVHHLQDGGERFNPESEFSGFIPGFEPAGKERVFVKDNYSSFSSPQFEAAIRGLQPGRVVVAGYGSTMCCLSTIIEGYHKGLEMVFLKDASLAKRTDAGDEAATHAFATAIIATFATVLTVDEWLNG